MSPRRSSRARSSANPPPTALSQTASSTSSTTLKNTQVTNNKRSESVEEDNTTATSTLDDEKTSATNEPIMPRRSRRNGGDEAGGSQVVKTSDGAGVAGFEDLHGDLGEEDSEEVTRCICGKAEYPGPTYNLVYARGDTASAESMTKDMGDFFVQCDKCLVWQHGGCVGFQDEAELPDEYYCELCRPKLHKIYKEQNGRRSHYFTSQQKHHKGTPQLQHATSITESRTVVAGAKKEGGDASRSSSLSSGEARKREGRKAGSVSESTKRRATMNSRGAYDEDEALRRAIEESNRETGTLGKRTRDLDDDSKQALKRQRTGSMSTDSKRSASPTATDDNGPSGRKSKQSLRGAAAKNNKEREARERAKEQQLAARAEAASKRHARSERRRGDDSPPPSPSVSPSKGNALKVGGGKDSASKPSTKGKNSRNARGPGGGARRLGRNQYTRDRDLALANAHNGGLDSDTPMRDNHDNANGTSPSGNHNGINGESGRSSKAKTHPARTSLNEMKRRVAAILEFVGQMQSQSPNQSQSQSQTRKESGKGNGLSKLSTALENGSGSTSDKDTNGNGGNTPTAADASSATETAIVAGLVKAVQDATAAAATTASSTDDAPSTTAITPPDNNIEEKDNNHKEKENAKPKFSNDHDFKELGSSQMMEQLTRELMGWQRVYGVYSR